MTKRLNMILLTLLLVIGGPIYWLFFDTSPWNVRPQPLAIGQLRKLAEEIPGQKPVKIEMEMSAWALVPGDVLAAGYGLKRRMVGVISFFLEVPGKGPVVIDTGTTEALARAIRYDKFDAPGQKRIDDRLSKASLILVTHEHGDHIGGIAALATQPNGLEILSHARLNAFQVPAADTTGLLPWTGKVRISPNLSGQSPMAVAPGIVVIPAPSHTPGSQMIFVKLASGAEYLFTGDIATFAVSWQQLRARSRLVTDFIAPEDRRVTMSWLKAIAALKASDPGLVVVPGHDFDWLVDRRTHSGIKRIATPVTDKDAGT